MTKSRGIRNMHGLSKSSIYNIWNSMKSRCDLPTNAAYANYGGRGITVCDRWRDFDNFVADMGERPKGLSLDRIDNSKGYSPENCRWATRVQQARNTRYSRPITIDGETLLLVEWCERFAMPYATVHRRLVMGWTEEAAIKTPPVKDRFGLAFKALIHEAEQQTVLIDGKMMTFSEAAQIAPLGKPAIWTRLKRGWPPELAFTVPALKGQRIGFKARAWGAQNGVVFDKEAEAA